MKSLEISGLTFEQFQVQAWPQNTCHSLHHLLPGVHTQDTPTPITFISTNKLLVDVVDKTQYAMYFEYLDILFALHSLHDSFDPSYTGSFNTLSYISFIEVNSRAGHHITNCNTGSLPPLKLLAPTFIGSQDFGMGCHLLISLSSTRSTNCIKIY